MITIPLDISVRHLNLIKIFFEANELFDLGFKLEIAKTPLETPLQITPYYGGGPAREITFTQTKQTMVCIYDDTNDHQVSKMVDLSLKHLGFKNMLHDFLNKCNITYDHTI
jgi:hypothetical protein